METIESDNVSFAGSWGEVLDCEGHQVPPGVLHVVPQGAQQEVLEGSREEEPLCKAEGMSEMQ